MQLVTNSYTAAFGQRSLKIIRGWNQEVARQLVELSREPEIVQFTPKDATERFSSIDAANRWHALKKRWTYFLIDEEGAVGGVAWFSLELRPALGADYTFAVRLYDRFRGQHLAGDFLEAAHADLRETGYRGATWLVADQTNERAVRFYAKHDYAAVAAKDGRVVMVRK